MPIKCAFTSLMWLISGTLVTMLIYFVYYLVIIPVSYLPFGVLYFISNFIYFLIYRVFGYRRKVVLENIRNSFPEITVRECKQIEKEFYRHLSDLVVESVKAFSISKENCIKRMVVINPEIFEPYYDKGQSVIAIGGHNGNWEMYAVAGAIQLKHRVEALYTAFQNRFFDAKMRVSRSRFGFKMIPTSTKEELDPDNGKPKLAIFAIDQCPRKTQRVHWMTFLNQETAVQFGAEKYARTHDTPVFFGNIYKVKRGHYEVKYELICEDPKEMEHGEIIAEGTRRLEKTIRNQSAYWLWSHKRWKHSREDADRALAALKT